MKPLSRPHRPLCHSSIYLLSIHPPPRVELLTGWQGEPNSVAFCSEFLAVLDDMLLLPDAGVMP